jgi:hypothetical protein
MKLLKLEILKNQQFSTDEISQMIRKIKFLFFLQFHDAQKIRKNKKIKFRGKI